MVSCWKKRGRNSIYNRLERIEAFMENIMSSVNDLKPILDTIGVDASAAATDAASASSGLAALIAKLNSISQPSGLNAADQATLDAAVAEAGGLQTNMDSLKSAMDQLAASANPASGS